ncbi:hypothetical protein [Natronococcus wangiae]|uniref:hypothetical protein n=1 Tax=Natronococcus wangiae TaxID=3068275 RepID=UPI00273D34EF|nr:hypothetical protein [Natronococcus sp. AD5]
MTAVETPPIATPSGETFYPAWLRSREWWVSWILDGVERKRPVAPWQTGHAYPVEWRGDLSADERPETTFDTASRWVDFNHDKLGLSFPDDALSDSLGLGIILPVDRPSHDERVVLIDWDDVRDSETEEIHPVAAEYIQRFGGYVEISRSGEGLHQFVLGGLRHRDKFIAPIDDELFVGDDLPQVEIYDGGRHVAMTGQHVAGTDRDLVEGQECIDAIVSEYAQAELDSGHRTYDPETGATPADDASWSESEVTSTPVPEPDPCEYDGPSLDELRDGKPADRSLPYHAIVEAFCEGYAGVLNWRLEGAAAALGQREDRTVGEIVTDLRGDDRDGGSAGFDRKTPGRVEYDHKRAACGEFSPPSWKTLVSWGVLPAGSEPTEPTPMSTGEHDIETCEPPIRDAQPFDREQRWTDLQSDRFDAVLEDDKLHVWGDEAGAGKTTNAQRAALEHDMDHVVYFDKHRKAREAITDDVLPDDAEYRHQKGGEQKAAGGCMDVDFSDDEGCPEHGHPSECPTMCPVYTQGEDIREPFKALVREVGPNKAHQILNLADKTEHPWHGGKCRWQEQYSAVESAGNVVAVHPYMTQKTIRDSRLNIIDETPDLNAFDRSYSVDKLTRIANTLETIADRKPEDDPIHHNARRFALFTRAVVDVLTDADSEASELADLKLPSPVVNAYETTDPMAGTYVERETATEGWQVAEQLARLKVAFGERVVERMTRDEWEGTPVSIDVVLAAAVAAGLDETLTMQAVAVSPYLDGCPWCGDEIDFNNGARCCSSETCDWHEQHNALIQRDAEPARATAWIHHDSDGNIGLNLRTLPLTSELPDPANTLILDATATPEKVAALFGIDLDDVAVSGNEPLEIPNLRTTKVLDGQYHGGTIDSAIEEEWKSAVRIQRSINTIGDVYRKPLYVIEKRLIDEFNFPENAVVIHYHGARGLNFSDCDAVVCIGAPHPNVDDLSHDAELLAMGRDDLRVGGEEHSTRRDATNPPIYRKLHYEDDHGRGRAVPTKHYTGLVGALFRETREKELVQAVHRIRPLLADDGEQKHAYLLTNVPTRLPIDDVCTFDELADPLKALLPVPDGAVRLLDAIDRVVNNRQSKPDGFRADQLVTTTDDGTIVNNKRELHRLATLSGLNITYATVSRWVNDLEDLGLLHPQEYEQRRGVRYATDVATLTSALQVLSSNGGLKVAAIQRFRALAASADGTLEWLKWARSAIGLRGDRSEWDPPPNPSD